MNYACISDQPFVTTKDLSKRKPLSEEAKARKAFFHTQLFFMMPVIKTWHLFL